MELAESEGPLVSLEAGSDGQSIGVGRLLPFIPASKGGTSGHLSAGMSQVSWMFEGCCFPP